MTYTRTERVMHDERIRTAVFGPRPPVETGEDARRVARANVRGTLLSAMADTLGWAVSMWLGEGSDAAMVEYELAFSEVSGLLADDEIADANWLIAYTSQLVADIRAYAQGADLDTIRCGTACEHFHANADPRGDRGAKSLEAGFGDACRAQGDRRLMLGLYDVHPQCPRLQARSVAKRAAAAVIESPHRDAIAL